MGRLGAQVGRSVRIDHTWNLILAGRHNDFEGWRAERQLSDWFRQRGNPMSPNSPLSLGLSRQELVFNQSHHDIVVPSAVHESCLSFPAFNNEAAFFICSDGALIVGKHSDPDPMKLQVSKGVSQKQENSFATQAFTKQCRIENSDCHRRTPVMEINIIQPDLTYKPAVNLDHPCMRMIDESLDPSRRTVSCQRTHGTPAYSKHLNYFCVISQGKASFYVIGRSLPQPEIFSFQYGGHGLSQGFAKIPTAATILHLTFADRYPSSRRSCASSAFRRNQRRCERPGWGSFADRQLSAKSSLKRTVRSRPTSDNFPRQKKPAAPATGNSCL